jgi:hypothetical protein
MFINMSSQNQVTGSSQSAQRSGFGRFGHQPANHPGGFGHQPANHPGGFGHQPANHPGGFGPVPSKPLNQFGGSNQTINQSDGFGRHLNNSGSGLPEYQLASVPGQRSSSAPHSQMLHGQFIAAGQSGNYFRDFPQNPPTVSKFSEIIDTDVDPDVEFDIENSEYLIAYMNSSVLQYILHIAFTDSGVTLKAIKLSSNELYTNFIPVNKFVDLKMNEFMNAIRVRDHMIFIRHRNPPINDTVTFGEVMPENSGRRTGKRRCTVFYAENNFPYQIDVQKTICLNCMGNGFQILTTLHLSTSETMKSALYNKYCMSMPVVRTHSVDI